MRVIALVTGMLMLYGCPSSIQYPKCETDDDCKANAAGEAIAEYCVNQQCQQCREDSHCVDGQVCKDGRCGAASECPCPEGKTCESDKCVAFECAQDADCSAGQRCENHACLAMRCMSDMECGGGSHCSEGLCVAGEATSVAATCRSMDPASGQSIALQTITFDFDKADLSAETRKALEQNAQCLQLAPSLTVVIEGHCDERGTQEYNLALGEKRAAAVRQYMRNLGIDPERLRTISKGKNEPICNDSSDDCYARNRRVEFGQER